MPAKSNAITMAPTPALVPVESNNKKNTGLVTTAGDQGLQLKLQILLGSNNEVKSKSTNMTDKNTGLVTTAGDQGLQLLRDNLTTAGLQFFRDSFAGLGVEQETEELLRTAAAADFLQFILAEHPEYLKEGDLKNTGLVTTAGDQDLQLLRDTLAPLGGDLQEQGTEELLITPDLARQFLRSWKLRRSSSGSDFIQFIETEYPDLFR